MCARVLIANFDTLRSAFTPYAERHKYKNLSFAAYARTLGSSRTSQDLLALLVLVGGEGG